MVSSLLAALVSKLLQENIMTHFNIDTNSDKTAQLRSLTVIIIKQAVKQIIPEWTFEKQQRYTVNFSMVQGRHTTAAAYICICCGTTSPDLYSWSNDFGSGGQRHTGLYFNVEIGFYHFTVNVLLRYNHEGQGCNCVPDTTYFNIKWTRPVKLP